MGESHKSDVGVAMVALPGLFFLMATDNGKVGQGGIFYERSAGLETGHVVIPLPLSPNLFGN